VTHDLLGLFDRFTPKFARQYVNLSQMMRTAFEAYRDDVRARAFPSANTNHPADECGKRLSLARTMRKTDHARRHFWDRRVGLLVWCPPQSTCGCDADRELARTGANPAARAAACGGCHGKKIRIALHVTDEISQVGRGRGALVLTKSTKTLLPPRPPCACWPLMVWRSRCRTVWATWKFCSAASDQRGATLGVTTLGASTSGHRAWSSAAAREKTVLAQRTAQDVRVGEVAALFERGRLKADVTDDVSALVWGKLAINAAVNPLTRILGVPNGALLESEWRARCLSQAATEVAAVAAAQHIALPFDDVVQHVEQAVQGDWAQPVVDAADVERGAATEIDAICGAVGATRGRVGHQHALNRTLFALVKALEPTYAQSETGSV